MSHTFTVTFAGLKNVNHLHDRCIASGHVSSFHCTSLLSVAPGYRLRAQGPIQELWTIFLNNAFSNVSLCYLLSDKQ